ncbi:MAG: hypothetical protein KDA84_26930, partial [Planctomycetaceae bacterium]|nr:hypothetical protein [Planctomycetaceae bacterium]
MPGPLGQRLLDKAQDPALRPPCQGVLLAEVLRRRVEGSRELAASMVPNPLPKDTEQRERAVTAAQALWRQADDCGWPIFWPVAQGDREFGRAVIMPVAHEGFRGDTMLVRLDEEQLRS